MSQFKISDDEKLYRCSKCGEWRAVGGPPCCGVIH